MDANPYKSPEANLDEPPRPHEQINPTGLRFARAAQTSGLAIDGLRLVSDALHYAPRLIAAAAPGQHLRGWQLCEAVARYSEELFGSEAADVLSQWGLVAGEDIGAAVDSLIKEGLMQASADDSAADFAGLGSLADMISSSGRPSSKHAMNQNPYQSPNTGPAVEAAGIDASNGNPLLLGAILVVFIALMLWLLKFVRGW